ncbi:DUF2382 domain-containing protein [Actinoalloteichus hymeniacidonis]|uniref:Uncharacterized protein n=1 Tax=Actinoalloteichus hymeniacidonis TaxID=340345 RepID=A0AAC9N0B1_9PSEU|nr:PRC and DUF2382 domain-containing protein [Actinoalloteichus hymeniacidonis]AOS65235.1 PRC-barrel protein,protein of unknown function (DUF2382) [Actinoalloteichus hymeniacidonis]MBB5906684.1 uncharacterized protein (TIGR02271 family) [Actinoalloteichus hymeniacidonis]
MTSGIQDIKRLPGRTVYGADGIKIGKIAQVWLDGPSGEPSWISVHTGLFGMRESFVPVAGMRRTDEGDVEVRYNREQVHEAPQVAPDQGELPIEDESRLYDYYGLPSQRQSTESLSTDRSSTLSGGDVESTDGFGQNRSAEGAAGAAGLAGLAGTARRPDTSAEARAGQQRAASTYPEMLEAEKRAADASSVPTPTSSTDEIPGAPGPPRRSAQSGGTPGTRQADRGEAITRCEEQLSVHAEQVETGRAWLRKYVVTEEVQIKVPLKRERVRMETEPITAADRDAAAGADLRIHEEQREVVLHEERAVVERRTVPVERVRLTTETTTEEQTITDRVRKERFEFNDGQDHGNRPA